MIGMNFKESSTVEWPVTGSTATRGSILNRWRWAATRRNVRPTCSRVGCPIATPSLPGSRHHGNRVRPKPAVGRASRSELWPASAAPEPASRDPSAPRNLNPFTRSDAKPILVSHSILHYCHKNFFFFKTIQPSQSIIIIIIQPSFISIDFYYYYIRSSTFIHIQVSFVQQ